MDFKWSERQYDLKTFVKKHSKNLPLIVKVTEGFCGLDEKDDYSFGTDDEYRLTHLNKQPRMIVKDKIGRHISIPTNRPLRFCRLFTDGTKGKSSRLCDLMMTLSEGDQLISANDQQVDFWLSGDKKMSTKLGVLTFVAEYQERFLVGNTISEGTLLCEPLVIPAYASIKIALADGLDGQLAEQFDILREQFAREASNFKNHMANGNLEIMLFEGKVTDYKDYDYIKPSNFLRMDSNAAETSSTLKLPPEPKPRSVPMTKPSTLPRNSLKKHSSGNVTSPNSPSSPILSPKPTARDQQTGSSMNSFLQGRSMKPPSRPPPELPSTKTVPVTHKETIHQFDPTTPSDQTMPDNVPPLPPPRNPSLKKPNPLHTSMKMENTLKQMKEVQYQNKVGVVNPMASPTLDDNTADTYEDTEPDYLQSSSINKPPEEDAVEEDEGNYEDIDEVKVRAIPDHKNGQNKTEPLGNTPKHPTSDSMPIPTSVSQHKKECTPPLVPKDEGMREECKTEETVDAAGRGYSSFQLLRREQRIAEMKQKSVEEVCDLLDLLKLPQFKKKFQKNDIDGDLLSELTVSDLITDLGFNNLQAKKLYKNITEGWQPK